MNVYQFTIYITYCVVVLLLRNVDTHELQVESIKSVPIIKTEHPYLTYTIRLSIGTTTTTNDFQDITVQIDTTSPISVLPSSNTTSFSSLSLNQTLCTSTLTSTLCGSLLSDNISLNFNTLLSSFTFLLPTHITPSVPFIGHLSLSYLPHPTLPSTTHILTTLKHQSIISKSIFLISNNTLYLGGIPRQFNNLAYSSCALSSSFSLDDEFKHGWLCELSHLIVDSTNSDFTKHAVALYNTKVLFATAHPYITVPMYHYKLFKEEFLKKHYVTECKEMKSEKDELYWVCEPTEKFAFINVRFVIGGYVYGFNSKKLFRKGDNGKMEMVVRFKKENDRVWVFGVPFFKEYTVVFNGEDKEIGFYGGNKEDIRTVWKGYTNYNNNSNNHYTGMLICVAIVVVLTVFTVASVFSLWKGMLMKKEGKLIKNELAP